MNEYKGKFLSTLLKFSFNTGFFGLGKNKKYPKISLKMIMETFTIKKCISTVVI